MMKYLPIAPLILIVFLFCGCASIDKPRQPAHGVSSGWPQIYALGSK